MRHYKKYSSLIWFVMIVVYGCIDPYNPSLSPSQTSILVVDGFLNGTSNSVAVKLSRTTGLDEEQAFPAEVNATLTVEGEDGSRYVVNEMGNGNYAATQLPLNRANRYRLRIVTIDRKEYVSNFITLNQSPPISDVVWKPKEDGITLYVNTSDPEGKTRYYQWTYTETWEYNSYYYSSNILVDGEVFSRPRSESINVCWESENSSRILINSTVRLQQDVVNDFPIHFIPKGSIKLSRVYSLLVQQRAISQEAYLFWEQLQETTENLGGLFDPLPSQVTGNIVAVSNASEPVLGYFSGGYVQEKRIYVRFYELPQYLLFTPRTSCELDSIPIQDISSYPNSTLLIGGYGITLEGYLTSSVACIDCRWSGGITTKPDYWP